jgi:hypothetical protein
MEESVRVWLSKHGASMPGLSEIVRAFVIDDPSRGFITLESTSGEGFADGGCAALRAFTERVIASVKGQVRYYDNYDVHEHEAPNSDVHGTPAGNLYRSTWFTSAAPERIAQEITRWQQDEASGLEGYSRSWLIRGISDETVHALSVEWSTEHALRNVAPAATDPLFDRMKDALSSEPQTYNVRSGGDLAAGESDA